MHFICYILVDKKKIAEFSRGHSKISPRESSAIRTSGSVIRGMSEPNKYAYVFLATATKRARLEGRVEMPTTLHSQDSVKHQCRRPIALLAPIRSEFAEECFLVEPKAFPMRVQRRR